MWMSERSGIAQDVLCTVLKNVAQTHHTPFFPEPLRSFALHTTPTSKPRWQQDLQNNVLPLPAGLVSSVFAHTANPPKRTGHTAVRLKTKT